jgi:serine/threonine-protein kinase
VKTSPPPAATGIVPNLGNELLSSAESSLQASGFHHYSWIYECYGSQNINKVVQQNPGAGTRLALSATVSMYLQANNCVTLPNVIGLQLSNAESTLEQAGIPGPEIYWIYQCFGSPNTGAVIVESPNAGTSVGTNQQVTIKLQANNC